MRQNKPFIIEGQAQVINHTYFVPKTRKQLRQDVNKVVFNITAQFAKWIIVIALVMALIVELAGG